MNKLNRVMLMLIAMAAIMLLAVGIDKGLQRHERKMWEIEREAVYEEARADIASMQANIQTLSEDPEALISYIEENELNYTEKKEVFLEEPDRAEGDGSVSDNEAYKGEAENLVSGNSVPGKLSAGRSCIRQSAFSRRREGDLCFLRKYHEDQQTG